MAENCPHCVTGLPAVGDAFCPQCGSEFASKPKELPAFLRRKEEISERTGQISREIPERSEDSAKRPVGVFLLAILFLGAGVQLAYGSLQNLDKIDPASQAIGLSPTAFALAISFLSLLGIAAGIGLVLNQRWGWWLAALYCVYGISRNVNALRFLIGAPVESFDSSHSPGFYYLVHIIRLGFFALFTLYFFKEDVLRYFALENLSKVKALCSLAGVCGMVGVIGSLVAWLNI